MIGIVATTLTGCDWLQYLGDSSHTSSTADAGIAATDIPNLASKWRWQPTGIPGRDNTLFSTPATWRGKIFVGSNNGVLVALNEQNGSQIWQHDFGSQPVLTCNGGGIVSSPAVADDGNGNPLVYIHAPDGYLYELDGNTGITKWRTVVQIPSTTVNDVFAWSSPALFGGRVYVGIASNCDTPFVRGAVKSFNATTGAPVATGWMMPSGYVGAGVWTSVAVDATGAYVSTGSVTASVQSQHPPTTTNGFNQYSIIKLDPVTLARTGKWAAPSAPTLGDPDFASSPVLFDGTIAGIKTPMVGACNKDGNFYALRRDTMQLVWQRRVGIPTDAGEANCIAGGM